MNYMLAKTPAEVRNYLVYRLRHVSALDQQWGVWGAGPENHPGNKDGWEQNPKATAVDHQHGRLRRAEPEYTLAIMYNLGGYAEMGDIGFHYGTNKLTQIASMLFQGHQTQQPTPQASAVP